MNTLIGNVRSPNRIFVVAMEEMVVLFGRTTSMGECKEGEKRGVETSNERKKLLLVAESNQGRDGSVVEIGSATS